MLSSIARRFHATNMRLEGEISELKAAVPSGNKKAPQAERVTHACIAEIRRSLSHFACLAFLVVAGHDFFDQIAHIANLASINKRHISHKGKDIRAWEKRPELARQGVPVVHASGSIVLFKLQ